MWNNPDFKNKTATVNQTGASYTVIDNVAVFDSTGNDACNNGRIIINKDTIMAIGPKNEVSLPKESHIIDECDIYDIKL